MRSCLEGLVGTRNGENGDAAQLNIATWLTIDRCDSGRPTGLKGGSRALRLRGHKNPKTGLKETATAKQQ